MYPGEFTNEKGNHQNSRITPLYLNINTQSVTIVECLVCLGTCVLAERKRFNFTYFHCSTSSKTMQKVFPYILRDFKNAPFYILCLFHMINLSVFSLSCFILLQNGPWFAIISICSCCSFWRNIDVSVFQQLSSDKCEFDSIWKQTLLGGSQMS